MGRRDDARDVSPTTPACTALTQERVRGYLARIGHPPVPEPTAEALISLQDAHVRTVPFENLDIHLARPLSLDLEDLTAKVIDRRRGGFCYELNGLFTALLAALGYDTHLVEARMRNADDSLGARFDHARIMVTIDDHTFVADVGTGASPRGPIRLVERAQQIGHVTYRVRARGNRYDSQTLDADRWTPDWSFDTIPRTLTDFADRCRFHERSPDSHFTHKPIATLVTTNGHVTLADRQLITTVDGRRHEEAVDDPLAVLDDRFGIAIPRWPGS